MKKFFPVLSALLIVTACKKETVQPDQAFTPANSKHISFNVDGTNYNFSDNEFYAEDLGDFIHVSYYDSITHDYFVFNFDENVPIGTYEFNYDTGFQFVYSYNVNHNQFEVYEWINHTGTAQVTLHDTLNNFIIGNFSCPVQKNVSPHDIKLVNYGTFSIHY